MTFPVLLLATSSIGWLFMVNLAVRDPGFSVESDYYNKASNYDQVIEQRRANERLGWRFAVTEFRAEAQAGSLPKSALVVLRASDGSQQSLSGLKIRATAFPTARGNDVQNLVFKQDSEGAYVASLLRPRVGLWELRLDVAGPEGQRFVESKSMELFWPDAEAEGGPS